MEEILKKNFLNSIKKNLNGILLIIFSACLTSLGQLLWKLGNERVILVLLGFVLYGFGAILMIISFKFGSYSVIQPFLSISYVFSLYLGHIILNERMELNKILGIVIIMIGVGFIAIGDD